MTTIQLDVHALSARALDSVTKLSPFQAVQTDGQKLTAEQLNRLDLAELIGGWLRHRYPELAPFSELMLLVSFVYI